MLVKAASHIELTDDITYVALTGVCCDYVEKNSACYNDTTVYRHYFELLFVDMTTHIGDTRPNMISRNHSQMLLIYYNSFQMWEILPYCMAKAGVDIFTKCLSLGRISWKW